MKQVVFLTRLYSPHIGGVEKHVEKISQLLRSRFQVTVITEQYHSKIKLKEKISAINIFRIPTHKLKEKQKKWHIWRWLWKNIKLLSQADIIHIHDVFFWFLPFRLLFPFKKVFITFHGYETDFPPKPSAISQRRLAVLLTQGNICVGDFIQKWYGVRPTITTYGAVDSHNNVSRSKTNNINVLIAGRLEKDVGMHIFLKAARQLKKKYGRKISFTIAGDGRYKQKFESIGKTLGFVKNLNNQIKKSDYVFASSYLTILEAMAAKKLVFAVYDNPLKEDYLTTHPAARNMIISKSSSELTNNFEKTLKDSTNQKALTGLAFNWSTQQTWKRLATQYLKLWGEDSGKDYCTIYVARHGQTNWNLLQKLEGHKDSPLTKKGLEQAKSLAMKFKTVKFDAVFSSDLLRAKRTAEIISLEKKVTVKTTQALRERTFGDHEGRTFDEFMETFKDLIKLRETLTEKERYSFKLTPEIESDEELVSRMIVFLRQIAIAHLGKNVLIISHGGTMRALLIHLGFATQMELSFGAVTNLGLIKLQSDGVDFVIKETSGISKSSIK